MGQKISEKPSVHGCITKISVREELLFVYNLEPLNWLLLLVRVNENAIVVFIDFIQSQIP